MALSPQQRDALRSKIAHRVRDLPGSATVAAADKARRLKAEGRSVVDLSGGEYDALRKRLGRLVRTQVYPAPSPHRRNYPWPPI